MALGEAGLGKDLDRLHADFGAEHLFDSNGDRIKGFFLTKTAEFEDMDSTTSTMKILRSPQELAVGAVVEDRKLGKSWSVMRVEGDEGAYEHLLRAQ